MSTSESGPGAEAAVPKKGRIKTPRQPMPEQDPRRRRYNFEEVPRGYSEETARLEASRC